MKTISAFDVTEFCENPPSRVLASMGILTQVDCNDGDRRLKGLAALLAVILRTNRHEMVGFPGCSCVVVSSRALERTYIIRETPTADGTPALVVLTWIEWTWALGEVHFDVVNDVLPIGAIA